jgi:hypothetical protein
VRWRYYESTNEILAIGKRLKEKSKKRDKGKSKSCGKHKSPRNSTEKCWNCGKVRHFIKDYKEEKKKNKKENNDFD